MKTITLKTTAPTFIRGYSGTGAELAHAEWDDDSAVGQVYRCYTYDLQMGRRWHFAGKRTGIDAAVLWLREQGAVSFVVTASAELDGVTGD